jgi:hypothetical protein
LIFTVTCVVGTVLFSAGATGSDRSAFCAVMATDRLGCEEHLGPVVTRTAPDEPVAGAVAAVPAAPAVPAVAAVWAAAPAPTVAPATVPAPAAAPVGVASADVAAAPAGGSSPADTDTGAVAAGRSGSGAGPEAVPPAEVTPVDPQSAASGHHGRPITATAVMHVPTPEQPASEGQMAPLTDKAMVLLVGWVMLVLLGGGVCAGSTTGASRRRVRSR